MPFGEENHFTFLFPLFNMKVGDLFIMVGPTLLSGNLKNPAGVPGLPERTRQECRVYYYDIRNRLDSF